MYPLFNNNRAGCNWFVTSGSVPASTGATLIAPRLEEPLLAHYCSLDCRICLARVQIPQTIPYCIGKTSRCSVSTVYYCWMIAGFNFP